MLQWQNYVEPHSGRLIDSAFSALCSILQTLRVRYGLDMIYTYSSNILIAVSRLPCSEVAQPQGLCLGALTRPQC